MKEKIVAIIRKIAESSGDSLAGEDFVDIYTENYFKKEIDDFITLIQEERKEAVEGFRELRKKMSYSYYEMSDDKNTGDWIEELDKYLESEK